MNSFETKNNVLRFLQPQTKSKYPINEYGCNFRSLQAIAELKTRHPLLINQIEDMYNKALNFGWVDSECYVSKPENIINSVLELFKSNYKAWNCGKVSNGQALNWKGHQTDFDYCIIKLWQPDFINKHFVLGDKGFNLIFDPYPNSKSAKAWNVKDIYLYSFYEG